MSKRKRKDLTLEERVDAIKLLEKLSQVEVSKRLECSQAQVSRISSKKREIMLQWESNANPSCKRQRLGRHPEVDAALTTWFKDARSHDIPLSGPILQEKASELAAVLNKPDFIPSTGWLSRWKAQNAIRYGKAHLEKKDAGLQGAEKWAETVLPEFYAIISLKMFTTVTKQVFITGLYYRALPDGT